MVKIVNKGPAINEIKIAAIARDLGASLANDYKVFLLENNGGRPKPDIVDIDGLPGSPTSVQEFFAIDGGITASELSWQLDFIKECCSGHHVLPIACDSGGSLYCLKVLDGVASSVVFCDLDSPSREFYDVAPTFTEFLNKIREWEE